MVYLLGGSVGWRDFIVLALSRQVGDIERGEGVCVCCLLSFSVVRYLAPSNPADGGWVHVALLERTGTTYFLLCRTYIYKYIYTYIYIYGYPPLSMPGALDAS